MSAGILGSKKNIMDKIIANSCITTCHSDIESCFSPLRRIGIESFFFVRNYHKNNTFIDISNEISWTSHFLKGYLGEKYDSQSISNHMFLDANVSLWSANQGNVIWQEGFNEFEVKDGISITKTTTEFSDVFGFYIYNANPLTTESLINRVGALKIFMDYFYDQADDLIKKAMTQPFQIPKRYQSQNISTDHNEVSQSVMELLQGRERHLNMSGFLRLSNREKQCINLASEGLTCEEIGKIIFLSKRTVELYLQNAKNKTRCRNIVELSCKYSKFRDLMAI